MPLLAATNIVHSYGDRIILDGASLSVEQDERIGIVGRNGSGKSTLLKAMGGLLKQDSGEVTSARGCRIGYLHQDPDLDPDETLRGAAEGAFALLHRLHNELNDVFEDMASADGDDLDKLLKQQSRLEREIEAAGGYAVDHKIDAVLHGLGFTDSQFAIRVTDLSGGQKARLALARLLLEQPDVILLDEPTNHLDLVGRLWLEEFLSNEFRGAVVMISHDRYLLDRVVSRIVETEQGRLIEYPGNYEAFRRLRAERREAMHRAWENQQTAFRSEEQFIQKYKAGQRAKQARGRAARLTRARESSTLERPTELGLFNFQLPKAERTGDIVVSARGLTKKYTNDDGPEKVLFEDLDVTIKRGERWGIVGPNGAGKTTLVRCILGDLMPDAGSTKLGTRVAIGYFRQTQLHIDPDLQLYRYLQNVIQKENPNKPLSEQQARDLAGGFLFSGQEQEKEMGVLSGGERGRAALAALLASAKNVLMLDEPTNHLDIPSAERLEEALTYDAERKIGFDGTLVIISHDRALIDATCNNLLVLDGEGNVEHFIGNYSEWHARDVQRQREVQQAEQEAKRQREQEEKKRRAQEPEKPKPAPEKQSNPFSRLSMADLEKRIEKIESRIKAIDAEMSDPEVWKNTKKCNALGEERSKLTQDLEPLEFEWMGRAED